MFSFALLKSQSLEDKLDCKVQNTHRVFNCNFKNNILKDKGNFSRVRSAVLGIGTYKALGHLKAHFSIVVSSRESKLVIGEKNVAFCNVDINMSQSRSQLSVMSLTKLTFSANGNDLSKVTVDCMLINFDGTRSADYKSATIAAGTPKNPRPFGGTEFNGRGEGEWTAGAERKMRRGANINTPASALTFNNKVDLRNGDVLDSTANIKLTEIGAQSSFGCIKEFTLQGSASLSSAAAFT